MSGMRTGQALDKLVANLRETVVRADAPPTGAAPTDGSAGNFDAIDDDDVPF